MTLSVVQNLGYLKLSAGRKKDGKVIEYYSI
jgi:hypothetical protein